MFTSYQSGYLAHKLQLESGEEASLTQTIASARVDMNPHQVDAALFALASPLSNGVILADEVGLGKTIEASLVMAQRWAERKRKILLIVPATLRKQWQQELEEKFSLPSLIVEAKNFRNAKERNIDNPFDVEAAFGNPAIVICSYEFAARKDVELGKTPWNLVVLDEAHKLRNLYKNDGAKMARKLNAALAGRPKVMLSATPLQNNLQELYGLVSMIDPHFFGDLNSFKARYCRPKMARDEFESLRERLRAIVQRTLRRQVQEEGGIKFTRRYSMTEDFRPSTDELALYDEVSSYLQGDDLIAIKPGARHLVTLVIRKILASSSFAIQGTLTTMIERLEKQLPLEEVLHDYEGADDIADEEGIDEQDLPDPESLELEIAKLKKFRELAERIKRNEKAEALLRVLGRAFEFAERLGGARKAVIFTESVRTQAWLFTLLGQNGYAGKIVVLNGSNADEDSRATLQAWQVKHHGSSRVSGSRTADMKAALVDRFRHEAEIMICTEAGAEGINLQFCSLLVNYDLPWNPQRVEQRIGRVHRYGQKHDVVVVNFINKGNRADERVFELLSQKFQLFEGVFGASDEILGSIESGVDIERRIHDIYQQCRDDSQIDAEFNQLQETLKAELQTREQDTRRSLFENFDVDVVKRLNLRREKAERYLDEYQENMLTLARMMLPAATFEEHRFFHDGRWHDVNWQRTLEDDACFFRPKEGLGSELIENAKNTLSKLGAALIEFDLSHTENGQQSYLRTIAGQSGELVVDKLSLNTKKESIERLLVAARTDSGEALPVDVAERLLLVPATVKVDLAALSLNPDLLLQVVHQEAEQLAAGNKRNERYFEEETGKLDRWAEDRRVALDIRLRQLDQEIKEARSAARQLPSLQEKMNAKRELKVLERERDSVMLDYHEEKKRIEAEEDLLIADVEDALKITPQRERLFSIRWQLKG
ncbi:SNF2-related protein [Janthinobacterium sp. SUN026]|uniref:SNF2-related protein n=1 Tax=Janthinobacterium sp. SUN026 TaxID=3002438 RepID=UPI0025B265F4|nr:SNF2-related protein [Janthinobacterium sp. SUN026]MDN2675225.1 SNF2-related protein [Janthinobacterium sp. SUN026]